MGIMEQNNMMNLIKVKILNPFNKISIKESASMITKRYLLVVFNSLSKIPNFNLGLDEFI